MFDLDVSGNSEPMPQGKPQAKTALARLLVFQPCNDSLMLADLVAQTWYHSIYERFPRPFGRFDLKHG
jgi:hypothetical protein